MINNVIPFQPKPTTELKLILLPPAEPEEVSPEDVKFFYKNLMCILNDNN